MPYSLSQPGTPRIFCLQDPTWKTLTSSVNLAGCSLCPQGGSVHLQLQVFPALNLRLSLLVFLGPRLRALQDLTAGKFMEWV